MGDVAVGHNDGGGVDAEPDGPLEGGDAADAEPDGGVLDGDVDAPWD